MRSMFLLVVALLLPVTSSAQGYESHRDVIIGQLNTLSSAISGDNYGSMGGVFGSSELLGRVDVGDTAWVEVRLEAGTEYFFVGACDLDCSDLDLFIRDAGASTVASDVEMDDYPVVGYTPSTSGYYQVGSRMVTCETAFCYYGLRAYRR